MISETDKLAIHRIKEILTMVGLGTEIETVSRDEANALCTFLDTLSGKPCLCGAFPFPHQRGKKCMSVFGG